MHLTVGIRESDTHTVGELFVLRMYVFLTTVRDLYWFSTIWFPRIKLIFIRDQHQIIIWYG